MYRDAYNTKGRTEKSFLMKQSCKVEDLYDDDAHSFMGRTERQWFLTGRFLKRSLRCRIIPR
jgi:hypothetical protein